MWTCCCTFQAQKAAQALLETDAGSADGQQSILGQLSKAMFDLSLGSMWRVHRMCAAAQGLSSWALELLLEQAEQVCCSPHMRHCIPIMPHGRTALLHRAKRSLLFSGHASAQGRMANARVA